MSHTALIVGATGIVGQNLANRLVAEGWTVHRPHTIIGHAIGNVMNMGSTLAVYASICRETGRPFLFPGCGRSLPPGSASRPPPIPATPRRLRTSCPPTPPPLLGRHRGPERTARKRARSPGLPLAHRRRSRPPDRMRDRHEQEPHPRLHRLPDHAGILLQPIRNPAVPALYSLKARPKTRAGGGVLFSTYFGQAPSRSLDPAALAVNRFPDQFKRREQHVP